MQHIIPHRPESDESPPKVIFTSGENLEILKGYKATVTRKGGIFRHKTEVIIAITGLSAEAADKLIASLKPLDRYYRLGEGGV